MSQIEHYVHAYYRSEQRDFGPAGRIIYTTQVEFIPDGAEIDALSGIAYGMTTLDAPGFPVDLPVGSRINVAWVRLGQRLEHHGTISGPPRAITYVDATPSLGGDVTQVAVTLHATLNRLHVTDLERGGSREITYPVVKKPPIG